MRQRRGADVRVGGQGLEHPGPGLEQVAPDEARRAVGRAGRLVAGSRGQFLREPAAHADGSGRPVAAPGAGFRGLRAAVEGAQRAELQGMGLARGAAVAHGDRGQGLQLLRRAARLAHSAQCLCEIQGEIEVFFFCSD